MAPAEARQITADRHRSVGRAVGVPAPFEIVTPLREPARANRRQMNMLLLRSLALAACIVVGSGSMASAAAANSTTGRAAHPADNVKIVDGRHLQVGAGCPSDTPAVKVVETRTKVRIRVVYTATNLLCLRVVRVTLRSPLGTRRIIDATTGRQVPKSPGD